MKLITLNEKNNSTQLITANEKTTLTLRFISLRLFK